MKYIVKTEVYNEELPYNKWFCFNSGNKYRIDDLVLALGLDRTDIGIVIVNEFAKTTNCQLNDKDRIRFVGKIYPEYL
jgi:hypothetical protein